MWFYVNNITHNRRDENFSPSPALPPVFCCVRLFFLQFFFRFCLNISNLFHISFHVSILLCSAAIMLWLFYSPLLHTTFTHTHNRECKKQQKQQQQRKFNLILSINHVLQRTTMFHSLLCLHMNSLPGLLGDIHLCASTNICYVSFSDYHWFVVVRFAR